ncbi:hypothetical protein VC83_00574 [Pseudogymnoascus destructans]|uniref:Uncharacterized protein n=1 Tax=Pseudogymnoascus destructans TaxID=655981 RepID=A0A177ANF5_9PEZI|nr:uncharacterized protein VC83_00574 [Pseudogymnoascus destructans]OAF63022.1 hypothetical protein VC83_00574 [Pseudogymnoascus destructans]
MSLQATMQVSIHSMNRSSLEKRYMYETLRCTATRVHNLMRAIELHRNRYHANNPDRNRHQTMARSLVSRIPTIDPYDATLDAPLSTNNIGGIKTTPSTKSQQYVLAAVP